MLENTLFQVSDSPMTHIVVAKYSDAQSFDNKPFVLDISVQVDDTDPGEKIEYSECSRYPSPENRDCAYAEFDQAKADKFYQKALRLVNGPIAR